MAESFWTKEDLTITMRPMLALSIAMLWSAPVLAATGTSIEVWKSATCSCCGNWVKHLEANGFAVKVNAAEPSMLATLKRQAGISEKLASCHTAKIDGYVIEGHVPAADIKKLLAEKPAGVIGLTVPGMPMGSPGMEQGGRAQPYDTLAIMKDGKTKVFVSHR